MSKQHPSERTGDQLLLSTLILNEDNPRFIKDKRGKQLLKSIEEFPEMLKVRPIVISSWEYPLVLAGNMRVGALRALGYGTIPKEWVVTADGLSEEQKQRFIVQDNLHSGEWNFDALANQYNTDDLTGWGLDVIFGDDEPAIAGTGADPGKTTRQAFIGDVFTISIGDSEEGSKPVGYTLQAPTPIPGTKLEEGEATQMFNAYLKEIDKAIMRFIKTAKKAGVPHTIKKNGEDITLLYDRNKGVEQKG